MVRCELSKILLGELSPVPHARVHFHCNNNRKLDKAAFNTLSLKKASCKPQNAGLNSRFSLGGINEPRILHSTYRLR